MMTSIAQPDGATPPRRAPRGYAEPPASRMGGLVPLLYALNFATGLPPQALLAPPNVLCPDVRPSPCVILRRDELAAVLRRSTRDVGAGRVALADVDRRLAGLVVSLEAFRVSDGSGVLVALSVVGPDPAAPDSGTTSGDLWRLACEALVRHQARLVHPGSIGEDAFLAVYGRTAQLAWLAKERVATASVTRLDGDAEWSIGAARSVAALAAERVGHHDTLDRSFVA